MRSLEKELKGQQDDTDVKHLKGVLLFSNVCYFAGLALAGVCNPMQVNQLRIAVK
jgi:hypothetical protein